jgi:hypothetical protein
MTDFATLIRLLAHHNIEFILVGAVPVLCRGAQRCTLFRGRMAIHPYRGRRERALLLASP